MIGKIRKIRKKWKAKTKALKKRLLRLVSKTPKRKFYYGFFSKYCRLRPKWVLIESFHGQTVSDSGLVLAQEIARLYPGQYRVFYATEDKKKHQAFVDAAGLQVELVDVTTFRYTRILACAQHIFSNASLPIYFIKRPGQVYMQTWHGTPLKTLGKQMRMGIESMYNVQHNFLQADYLTQPNAFTRDVILRDYNLEPLYTGKVVMAGYPRNKVFMEPEKGVALRRKLGLEDKTVYAYMPTWRGQSNHSVDVLEYAAQVKKIMQQVDSGLKDDQVLYVNFHPILHGAVQLDAYQHILPFPTEVSNYEFLNCADALITDYSSVFFDFSLTKKPIILFMYDYDTYLADRGLYMDVRTLPFRQIYQTEELVECLRSGACLQDDYSDTEYYHTFSKYDSPDVSEKLLKLAFTGDTGDFEIVDYAKNTEKTWKVLYPEMMNQISDFRTLARLADAQSVVLMEKKWFKDGMSPALYDHYNHAFPYVITTKTVPRTYLEAYLAYLGVRRVQKRLLQRDMQRTFPNLKIEGGYQRDTFLLEAGCTANMGAAVRVQLKQCTVEKGVLQLEYADVSAQYQVLQQALVSQKGCIMAAWDAQSDTAAAASYDLNGMIEDARLYVQTGCIPALIARDRQTDQSVLLLFDDDKKRLRAKERANAWNNAPYYYGIDTQEYTVSAAYNTPAFRRTAKNNKLENPSAALAELSPAKQSIPLVLLPFLTRKKKAPRCLMVWLTTPDTAMNRLWRGAALQALECKGRECAMHLFLEGVEPKQILGSTLEFRSKTEQIAIPFQMKTKPTHSGCELYLKVQLQDDMPLKELYWDAYVQIEQFGKPYRLRVYCNNSKLKLKLFFTNCQADAGNDHILFPYFGKKGALCYCYRPLSEYDTAAVRRREVLAYGLYRLFRPFWERQKNWVVFEKFCKTAQDNSYYFFKFCMENLPKNERKHIYYIIDPRESDYQNVAQYGRQVVPFMSLKHMLLSLSMKICISSDSTSHLYVWRSKPSIVRRTIKKKRELFLQHGVTAMKQVHQLFGKKGSSPMTYFVTCSRPEHDIVVREFGYAPQNVPVTGFARWDVLEDKSTPDDPFILMMPTWRSWLEEVDNDTFLQSDYYKNYSALLTDPALDEMLRRNHTRLVFYLHPKFAGYMNNFKDKISPRVTCIPFGQQPLNELMMRCKLLVTDYSSVCWDVLYQNKPVVYYQFDYDLYNEVHGSYLDMTTQLPGDRLTDAKDLVPCLDGYAASGFEMKPRYREMAEQYFMFRDNDNSRRIYQFLKSNGY